MCKPSTVTLRRYTPAEGADRMDATCLPPPASSRGMDTMSAVFHTPAMVRIYMEAGADTSPGFRLLIFALSSFPPPS
jgi:hypothetical protein